MATQSFEQLIAGANKIKTNELPESNTASLVGEQLIQMVNKQSEEHSERTAAISREQSDRAAAIKAEQDARIKGTTEYNVSVHHPTEGIGGTNKYTLEMAIQKIPDELRTVGIKCSFIGEDNSVQTYVYQGGTFTSADSWAQGNGGSSGGNMILKWDTDKATTRKQVKMKQRRAGMLITYKHPTEGWVNEQYNFSGANFDVDGNWELDRNWQPIHLSLIHISEPTRPY